MIAGAVYSKRQAGIVLASRPLWGTFPPVSHGVTAAQKLGLRYEEKALNYLENVCKQAISHLGFTYVSEEARGKRGTYFCWPDAIIFNSDLSVLTIVEIKRHHTVDAYVQLKYLYLPVISKAFPGKLVQCMELCQYFDPSIRFPSATAVLTSDEDLLKVVEAKRPSAMSVCIWTGR